jgi:hypothetical protein
MCQINTLRTFRWRHLLVKPERTYAYTWYMEPVQKKKHLLIKSECNLERGGGDYNLKYMKEGTEVKHLE